MISTALEAYYDQIQVYNKDGGCTFYLNTLQTPTQSTGTLKDVIFEKFVPVLTTLCMLGLKLLELLCASLCDFLGFLYAKNQE